MIPIDKNEIVICLKINSDNCDIFITKNVTTKGWGKKKKQIISWHGYILLLDSRDFPTLQDALLYYNKSHNIKHVYISLHEWFTIEVDFDNLLECAREMEV